MIARVVLAALWALAVVLVPSVAAYAAPSPAPAPTDRPATASAWVCETTPATLTAPERQDCAVTGWATLAPFPVYSPPAVQRVDVAAPLPVVAPAALPVTVPTPVPVREVSPAASQIAVEAFPQQSRDDLNRLATYVPGASAVLLLVSAVTVPLLMRRGV